MLARDPEPRLEIPFSKCSLIPDHIEPEVYVKDFFISYKYTWEENGVTNWAWDYESTKFYILRVTLNYNGSEGLTVQSTHSVNDLCIKAEIPPFTRSHVGIISTNPGGWKMTCSMGYTGVPPGDDCKAIEEILRKSEDVICDRIERFEEASNHPYTDFTSLCHSSGLHFIDVDFPPTKTSLGHTKSSVQWRRITDIFDSPTMFQTIDPSDILQGSLGDCWFLSSLASVSERPNLIKRLMKTKKINECGIYEVSLFKKGILHTYILDEYLPCSPFGKPIFTKTKSSELWTMLLEKAYAKSFGSYEALVSGDSCDGLTDLTGCPVEKIEFSDISPETIWEMLLKGEASSELIVTASVDEDKNDREKTGLVSHHAYSILDAKENERDGLRLVCIRNPWGNKEWTGRFHDGSTEWTAELRALCNYSDNPEDGLFWMCFGDFLHYFNSVNVCYCGRSQKALRLPQKIGAINDKLHFSILNIEVEGTLEWIGLHQEDKRGGQIDKNTDLTVLICEDSGNSYKPVKICHGNSRTDFTRVGLGPGKYRAFTFNSGRNFEKNPIHSVTLTLHYEGNVKMIFEETCFDSDLLHEVLVDFAKKFGESHVGMKMDGVVKPLLKFYYLNEAGVHIWVAEAIEAGICDCEIDIKITADLQNMVSLLSLPVGNTDIDAKFTSGKTTLLMCCMIKDRSETSCFNRKYTIQTTVRR